VPLPLIGVVGGSGLYELPGLTGVRRERLATPFGEPSGEYLLGSLGDQPLAFLPRHGPGHRFTPSEVNYRANLHGFKQLGAARVLSFSAVGSMREEIAPGHLVLADQFIDRTFARPKSFFGGGIVAHVAFADPVCPQLRRHALAAARAAGATAHDGGTYLCIEGPQFSTRAESELYRSWTVEAAGRSGTRRQLIDVIGMTAMPEAKLAREAELCYATVALATDYDCWHDGHEAVTVAQVIAILKKNVATAREVVRQVALTAGELAERTCSCGHALDHAVMTAPDAIPPAARERVALLLGKR